MIEHKAIHPKAVSLVKPDEESLEVQTVRLVATHLGVGIKCPTYMHLRAFVRATRERMFLKDQVHFDNLDRIPEDSWEPSPRWDETMRGRDWVKPLNVAGYFSGDQATSVLVTLSS